jgi:hypothetical protein
MDSGPPELGPARAHHFVLYFVYRACMLARLARPRGPSPAPVRQAQQQPPLALTTDSSCEVGHRRARGGIAQK